MYDVTEQAWFSSTNTYGQLSGSEKEETASHLTGTMQEILEQSIEARDVHVVRYDGSELKESDTKVVAQSTNQPNELQFLSVRGDIRIGDELTFDGLHYLVVTPETRTPLYDRSYGLRQTHSLKIFKETKVATGQRDPMGKPVYRIDKTEMLIRFAFDNKSRGGVDTSTWSSMNLPQGKVYFYVQLNPETSAWKETDVIDVFGKPFKIVNIDQTNTLENGAFGVLKVEADRAV